MSRSPSPPPARADAFPRDLYAQYKRATAYFLTWLRRAHAAYVVDVASQDDDGGRHPLDVYDGIVQAIIADPTKVSSAVWYAYPQAIHACQEAIALREQVALFFDEAADDAHRHFLDRMVAWLQLLTAIGGAHEQTKAASVDRSNYYDVLALPDECVATGDDAENGGEDKRDESHHSKPEIRSDDSSPPTDDAFVSDFHTQFACMLMELEELSEAVYAAFYDVRLEKKSMLEAGVVGKIAIQCAASVIANFQLQHSSLRDGEDLVTLVQDHIPPGQISQLVDRVTAAWEPRDDARYQYVRGTIVVDLVAMTRALVGVRDMLDARRHSPFREAEEMFRQPYDEAALLEIGVPDWSGNSELLQMCLLRHHLVLASILRSGVDDTVFMTFFDWFHSLFDDVSSKGVVPIHLAFVCSCWVRSVAALRGCLGRSVSATFMHMWDLYERLGHSLLRNGDRGASHQNKEGMITKIDQLPFAAPIIRCNPLLAAAVMLELQIDFLVNGSGALLWSMCRALSHIYSALRDRHLLDGIPIMEHTIQVYERLLFTPSRADATYGTFARSFLNHQDRLAIRPSTERDTKRHSLVAHDRSVVAKARFEKISRVAHIVETGHLGELPPQSLATWTSLLNAVSDVCRQELFGSRVLSLDSIRLCDDAWDVCRSLCDALGRRAYYDHMVDCHSMHASRVLENTVIFPLLPILDTLEHQDVADFRDSVLTSPLDIVGDGSDSTEAQYLYAQRAAAVIARHFGQQVAVQRNYFIFPSTPIWVSAEFGTSQSGDTVQASKATVKQEFYSLMKFLRTSPGPLPAQARDAFKRRVIATPGVLATTLPKQKGGLCSLFHLAAAGPARDIRLVEWLIQMGALDHEPRHFRDNGSVAKSRTLCNDLATHSAARRGDRQIVRHIVEAGCFRDINTLTYHTKESLAHLAVKHDCNKLLCWLVVCGADASMADGTGKFVWDYAPTQQLGKDLRRHAAFVQSVKQETCTSRCGRSPSGLVATPTTHGGERKPTKKTTKTKTKKKKKMATASSTSSSSSGRNQCAHDTTAVHATGLSLAMSELLLNDAGY